MAHFKFWILVIFWPMPGITDVQQLLPTNGSSSSTPQVTSTDASEVQTIELQTAVILPTSRSSNTQTEVKAHSDYDIFTHTLSFGSAYTRYIKPNLDTLARIETTISPPDEDSTTGQKSLFISSPENSDGRVPFTEWMPFKPATPTVFRQHDDTITSPEYSHGRTPFAEWHTPFTELMPFKPATPTVFRQHDDPIASPEYSHGHTPFAELSPFKSASVSHSSSWHTSTLPPVYSSAQTSPPDFEQTSPTSSIPASVIPVPSTSLQRSTGSINLIFQLVNESRPLNGTTIQSTSRSHIVQNSAPSMITSLSSTRPEISDISSSSTTSSRHHSRIPSSPTHSSTETITVSNDVPGPPRYTAFPGSETNTGPTSPAERGQSSGIIGGAIIGTSAIVALGTFTAWRIRRRKQQPARPPPPPSISRFSDGS
ncbi:hypothetical protein AJ79_10062 [Helicocarpus griseus UAMH5409]|uniref:Mid2 domain-containing protein n=1 Tax=Helicocarpus griseus UAMH5409 TaxID=1447875 RepID=A0A2B7W7E8_9EURO|nr:hypothetical protein AJ79_10062 [Helicocarpus griseus UAMH5409]